MAEEWGVPPWDIEAKTSARWAEWWTKRRNAQAEASKQIQNEQRRKTTRRK